MSAKKFASILNFSLLFIDVQGFLTAPKSPSLCPRTLTVSNAKTSSDVVTTFVVSDCDNDGILEAATFLVDNFWLGSKRQLLNEDDSHVPLSEAVRESLIQEQAEDLNERYGERMGKRALDSCLVLATPGDESLLGMLCLQELLMDSSKGDFLSSDKSEEIFKSAVATLSPQQRKIYKNANAKTIAQDLLPPSLNAICCISNLAVSTHARRQGVAQKLCQQAESIAKDEWYYDRVYLKVEASNDAAIKLYADKLGYTCVYHVDSDPAIRLDASAGEFVQINVDTMILTKLLL
jgi:ribosomal protein S18 acetylase RimI-like enzyme